MDLPSTLAARVTRLIAALAIALLTLAPHAPMARGMALTAPDGGAVELCLEGEGADAARCPVCALAAAMDVGRSASAPAPLAFATVRAAPTGSVAPVSRRFQNARPRDPPALA